MLVQVQGFPQRSNLNRLVTEVKIACHYIVCVMNLNVVTYTNRKVSCKKWQEWIKKGLLESVVKLVG